MKAPSIYQESALNSDVPPLLLDSRTASRALGICEKTLWSLTKRGEVAVCRIGTRRLYSPAALDDFIRRRETRGNQKA